MAARRKLCFAAVVYPIICEKCYLYDVYPVLYDFFLSYYVNALTDITGVYS